MRLFSYYLAALMVSVSMVTCAPVTEGLSAQAGGSHKQPDLDEYQSADGGYTDNNNMSAAAAEQNAIQQGVGPLQSVAGTAVSYVRDDIAPKLRDTVEPVRQAAKQLATSG